MNNKKKILFLITKATWGGAQRYVYDLATHLPKGRFTAVVAYGASGKLSEDLKAAGIQVYGVPSLDRDISPLSDVKSFWKICKGIRKGRPDVIHLNSSKAAALGALAARLCGVQKIIFTVHGWPFGEKRNFLVKTLIWKISWLTALLSHHVICVSDYDLGIAKRMPFIGRRAVRVYNGIDLHMQFGSGECIRSVFPQEAVITGTVGELNKNKNQVALIEQARATPDRYVAIVGEGELRPLLEQKIKEGGLEKRVKLFGFLPAQEVLKGFDRFALPSLKEGLPYVLLEAKLAGLPIETSGVGGTQEVVEKDLNEFSLEKMLGSTTALYLG